MSKSPGRTQQVIGFARARLLVSSKTVSSRLIRKDFAQELNRVYSKPVFWTGAYFVASCGGVTVE